MIKLKILKLLTCTVRQLFYEMLLHVHTTIQHFDMFLNIYHKEKTLLVHEVYLDQSSQRCRDSTTTVMSSLIQFKH